MNSDFWIGVALLLGPMTFFLLGWLIGKEYGKRLGQAQTACRVNCDPSPRRPTADTLFDVEQYRTPERRAVP